MGGSAAEVETVDRGPRREPAVPHLIREALALEDAAPGEADPLLDVGRPRTSCSRTWSREARREALDHREDLLGRPLAEAVIPRAPRRAAGAYWQKALITWRPGGATVGSAAVCE